MKLRRIHGFLLLVFLAAIGLIWISGLPLHQELRITEFEYERDNKALRTMFSRDWDWLIPIGPDEYSIDLVLKYRAPQQNPLYAGRLSLKVIRDNNQLIGFVAYYMKNSHHGVLNFIDVNPAYRGKGYAEKLARHAIQNMIERGATNITLVTYPHNTNAILLYKRIGFREIPSDSPRQVQYEYRI